MQHLTLLVAALAAFSTAAPVDTTAGKSIIMSYLERILTHFAVPCTDPYEEHMRNASTAFGWQLAGAAKDTDELDTTCNGLKDGAYTKWSNQGLVVDNIAGKSHSCPYRNSSC